jgi:hypothetical protein
MASRPELADALKRQKGCCFWHNSFCPKEILPEKATALWPQSVLRKTSDFIP